MHTVENKKLSVYLDQNILSELREDKPLRIDVEAILSIIFKHGGHPVFSWLHEREILQSDQPEQFIQVLETLDAYYLPDIASQVGSSTSSLTLEEGCPRDRISTSPNSFTNIQSSFEDGVQMLNFIRGGLPKNTASNLLVVISASAEQALSSLCDDIPAEFQELIRPIFETAARDLRLSIQSVPLTNLQTEAVNQKILWKSKLPNFAQVDEMPAEEVVEFMLTQIEGNTQQSLRLTFPRNFNKSNKPEIGEITGFAYLMFELGVVRAPKAQKGSLESRNKHFLGQFRDCQHIEAAARCCFFITFDKGVARLAKAVYAYAGIKTQVLLFKRTQSQK